MARESNGVRFLTFTMQKPDLHDAENSLELTALDAAEHELRPA